MCESTKVKIIINPIRNFRSQSTAKDINFLRECSERASMPIERIVISRSKLQDFPEEEDKTGMQANWPRSELIGSDCGQFTLLQTGNVFEDIATRGNYLK